MDKHAIGMMYKEGILEVTPEVRAVPLGQKRKRGRPKALPNCLVRSPGVQTSAINSLPSSPPIEQIELEPSPCQKTPKRKRAKPASPKKVSPKKAVVSTKRKAASPSPRKLRPRKK